MGLEPIEIVKVLSWVLAVLSIGIKVNEDEICPGSKLILLLVKIDEEELMEKSMSLMAFPEKIKITSRVDVNDPVRVRVNEIGEELVSRTEEGGDDEKETEGGGAEWRLMVLAAVTISWT